jgi:hypothetical protein
MPGQVDSLLREPLSGALADLGAEAAGEGAAAHPGVGGQILQLERMVQSVECPGSGGRGARVRDLGDGTLVIVSEAGMTTVWAVASTEASWATATEKSAAVATGPPSGVQVITS